MNTYNPNDFVNPMQIRSPYTGEASRPTIQTYTEGGKTYESAVFNDPITGQFIKKGIVSIKSADTGETLVDWESVFNSSSSTRQSRG